MHFTPEQREAWARDTRDSPFNKWLRERCCRLDGTLDLQRLQTLAADWGIDASRYAHLNPGQQRMNIGNRLRKAVPPSIYEGDQGLGPRGGSATPRRVLDISEAPLMRVDTAPPAGNLSALAVLDLLRLQGSVIDELRRRKIVRTGNAPLGDYAEWLFGKAYGWLLEANSSAGHDAVDAAGVRFQIKARRLSVGGAGSRQLSTIRNLDAAHFDMLAAVLFDPDYRVWRAALIPYETVLKRARKVAHVNGWRFMLDDAVWLLPSVKDITKALRKAEQP